VAISCSDSENAYRPHSQYAAFSADSLVFTDQALLLLLQPPAEGYILADYNIAGARKPTIPLQTSCDKETLYVRN